MSGARITLRQVAEKAQVHYATASTVLNGSKGSTRVSEETCRRVFQSAEELGDTVNRVAQQLRTQRSRVVGPLMGDLHLLESLLSRDLAGLLIWSETPTEAHTQMARRGLIYRGKVREQNCCERVCAFDDTAF